MSYNTTMFGVYRQRLKTQRWDQSPTTTGHDIVNYMNPKVNYDKWPRRLRPQSRRRSRTTEDFRDNSGNFLKPGNSSANLRSIRSLSVGRKSSRSPSASPRMRSSPLHPKVASLRKMLLKLGIGSNLNQKHGSRYNYSALEDENGAERLEMDRRLAKGISRDALLFAARTYCKHQSRYSLVEHLNDIGSRIDKNWFLIRDLTVKTERLMTLHPHDTDSPLTFQTDTKAALMELFQAIQHPYIYPVLDFEIVKVTSHTYVTTVIPYNAKGTLKDLIYRSSWKDDWTDKYQQRASGLPIKQVQRLGRQILEALLYLQDRGFPPCGHIHSGNIVLQNGVARLSGLENTLLGLTSRIYPIIRRRLRDNRDAIDSVCFGHVLFEMCAGYELSTAHPNAKHYDDIAAYPQAISVLEYIFGSGDHYPSIEEILCCEFFRNLDLREMRAMPLPPQFQLPYSPAVRVILKEVRRHQKQKGSRKRPDNVTFEGGSTPTSSETSTNPGGDDQTSYAKTVPEVEPISTSEYPIRHHDNSYENMDTSSPPNEVYHTPPPTPPMYPRNQSRYVNNLYIDAPLHKTRRFSSSYPKNSNSTGISSCLLSIPPEYLTNDTNQANGVIGNKSHAWS